MPRFQHSPTKRPGASRRKAQARKGWGWRPGTVWDALRPRLTRLVGWLQLLCSPTPTPQTFPPARTECKTDILSIRGKGPPPCRPWGARDWRYLGGGVYVRRAPCRPGRGPLTALRRGPASPSLCPLPTGSSTATRSTSRGGAAVSRCLTERTSLSNPRWSPRRTWSLTSSTAATFSSRGELIDQHPPTRAQTFPDPPRYLLTVGNIDILQGGG